MKYSLEQLKKCIDTANELSCVLKWIEGFEKELRQMRVYPTNTKSVAVYDFITEILEASS